MEQKAKEKLGGTNLNQTGQSIKVLPPDRFPDFARFVICGGEDQHLSGSGLASPYEIADFYELKALNCSERWWTAHAREAADAITTTSLTQAYDTAIAGFAYNPTLTQAYSIIVAGAYFTLLVWKERPSDDVLRPIFPTKVPKKVKKGVSYGPLIEKLLNEMPEYERRVLPEILYWNEPVFDYQPYYSVPESRRVSLSARFLWAMRYPIKARFPQLLPRSALFTAPDKKPAMGKGTKVRRNTTSSSS